MSKKIFVNGGVDVETRQFISSNKGYFSSGILKRGLTTKMDASSAPMWEIIFIDYKNKE